jgi:hypothetical protein
MERESMRARMIAGKRHDRPVGVIQIAGMRQDFGLAVSRHLLADYSKTGIKPSPKLTPCADGKT